MSYPLEGVRILELGQIIAGTYGCQVLSDLGAEVIKIETPEGDLGRIPSVAPYKGLSGLFLTFNRNKQSVVINLKIDEGRELFYDLVKISDVVIDNFRPGVLERLQIDYDTLSKINPRIIQCSVTGFGGTGEYKDLPALDLNIQAISQATWPSRASRDGRRSASAFRSPISAAGSIRARESWRRCSTANAPARDAASRSRCSTPCSTS